jgi:hypothetical protein
VIDRACAEEGESECCAIGEQQRNQRIPAVPWSDPRSGHLGRLGSVYVSFR